MSTVPHDLRAAARQAAYKQGNALPPASPGGEPGFPVTTAKQWDDALRAVGRVKDSARRAALAKLLRKTAPRFGMQHKLQHSWAAPGGHAHAGNPAAYTDLASTISLAGPDTHTHVHTHPNGSLPHTHPSFPDNDGDQDQDSVKGTGGGASGTSVTARSPLLRTPARGTPAAAGMSPQQFRVRAPARVAGALANPAGGIQLAATAAPARRHPIRGPMDVLVKSDGNGTAILKHRHGGADIARIRRTDDGRWVATVNGRDLEPRSMQRTAIMEAVGTWNDAVTGATRPAEAPLRPEPQQTPLMEQYGIPAMRAATFATPATGAGAGPRVTLAGSYNPDTDGDDDQLGPAGKAVYARLRGRGMDPQRARRLAKKAQAMRTVRAA
jgi:hypothetical protein